MNRHNSLKRTRRERDIQLRPPLVGVLRFPGAQNALEVVRSQAVPVELDRGSYKKKPSERRESQGKRGKNRRRKSERTSAPEACPHRDGGSKGVLLAQYEVSRLAQKPDHLAPPVSVPAVHEDFPVRCGGLVDMLDVVLDPGEEGGVAG